MTKPFTYSPKLIAFLLRHWNIDVPGPRLAELVGVPYTNLKAQIERLRKRGYDFKRKELPIGTQILRKNGKQGYTLKEKGADGQWKYVASIANPKQVKAKQIKPQPMPRARSMRKAPEKPKEMKRTGMTDEEKIAAGWRLIRTDKRTERLMSPENAAKWMAENQNKLTA